MSAVDWYAAENLYVSIDGVSGSSSAKISEPAEQIALRLDRGIRRAERIDRLIREVTAFLVAVARTYGEVELLGHRERRLAEPALSSSQLPVKLSVLMFVNSHG